jgi:DNA-binding protein HU-beta
VKNMAGATMNKQDLIETMANRAKVSKKSATVALEALTDSITKTLQNNGKVSISGFGAWYANKRAARMGVNPQRTSERIHIPETIVAKFTPGKNLKEAVRK